MADITLSSAVRNNLLALQNTADLLGRTQERLATGLKVNSALDDPTAFFTASSLNSRAGDLNRLLDSVGNAVQTVRAADKGLTAITKLVETAQANVRQALQKPGPSTTGGTTTGTVAFVDDTAAVATGIAIAADNAAKITSPTFANDAAVAAATGTVKIKIGTGATSTLDFDTTGLDTLAELDTAIDAIANVDAAASSASAGVLVIQATSVADDIVVTGTGGGFTAGTVEATPGGGTAAAFNNAVTANNTLTFTINGNSDTITFGTNDVTNQVSNRTELAARLTAISGAGGNTGATFTLNGSNQIQATAASVAAGTVTVTGTGDALTLSGFSNNQAFNTTNAALAAAATNFTVQAGSATAQTVSLAGVNSTSQLSTTLAALTGVTATVNTAGRVAITATTGTDSLTIGAGTGAAAVLGVTVGTNASTSVNNADRATLETEFNNLRTQIDQLTTDASFNGVNLLNGDNLTVTFNSSGTSSLAITGVTFNSAGLNITAAATNSFQTDANLNTRLTELGNAINTLRLQASTFGSNLSVVEIRQDFTKNLINTLETGAGNLTLADANQEGANTLALQTRQQLSSVALSLASQADQQVLRLF